MDVQSATMLAKLIGAGLACIAMAGAAIGIGLIFGFAVTEVFGIVGIVIAFLLLFATK